MAGRHADLSILITGGCGYVGTKLTQAVLDRTSQPVTVLDTMWFGNHLPPNPRLTLLPMDVRKIDELDLSPYDTVFHLANIANDPSVELNPYSSWEVNVLAGMRLVDRAARHGVKQFVFASSASVYGLKSEPRVTEELDLFPLSEYNKTKMVAERVVLSYSDSMVITVIRPATVCGYSPRMRLDLIVNLLTMQALTRGAVTVLGGAQTRPNIHVDDLVDAYLFALRSTSRRRLQRRLREPQRARHRQGGDTRGAGDRSTSSRRTIRGRTRSAPTSSWPPASLRSGTFRRPFARWPRPTATGA